MTEFNLDLAEKVLEQITLHPETHHQSSPTFCVVGWTIKLGKVRQNYERSASRAAEALGIDYDTARDIWETMNDNAARRKLVRLIKQEKRHRKAEERTARKADRAATKQAKADAKRAVRVEEETQRALDLQARAQVRAHAKVRPSEEKVPVSGPRDSKSSARR